MNEQDEGWTFPLSAPWIPPPPYHMTAESKYLYLFYDVDPEILRRDIPSPLELAPKESGPLVSVAIGDGHQPPHTHGVFHEGVVSVRVRYGDVTGWYVPYIWVDRDEAMIAGHIYGWPKQICDTTPLEEIGNQINGIVSRRGQLLFRITFTFNSLPLTHGLEPPDHKFKSLRGSTILLMKKIASPEKNGKVLKQLVRVDMEDFKLAEAYEGNGSIEFTRNAFYPNLHRYQPQEVRSAFYVRPDFILPYAQVIWEQFK